MARAIFEPEVTAKSARASNADLIEVACRRIQRIIQVSTTAATTLATPSNISCARSEKLAAPSATLNPNAPLTARAAATPIHTSRTA